jgi:alkanesulfonate monooxygenase SsuD/methylene tetrahydromethanopterin reductase-like flavin-dependent oxidoreductase (luciferase family)
MTGCIVGETHENALAKARELYERTPRDTGFEDWLAAYSERALLGSVDEVATRLDEYAQAGCDRVMLQHLQHTDLDSVRLIGREFSGPTSLRS